MVLLKKKQDFLVDAVIGGHVRSAVSFFMPLCEICIVLGVNREPSKKRKKYSDLRKGVTSK